MELQQQVPQRAALRHFLIGSGFVVASLAIYLGVAVYALTPGPKAIRPICEIVSSLARSLPSRSHWTPSLHEGGPSIGVEISDSGCFLAYY